ncbi:cell division protein FtsQ/DivIB [Cellulosimicrobium sp. Marseille-Q4280]|uniref:cell division protein FtsQ/DivIB n=1 Tax=Cellulosimicrobium sp. Marseille-Q4280 TaxID=2937992 RepID=UPI0020422D58|nr:cell division protein FtsQ/DivIB [Cellulosimicrobium sp. Marseille-Q4280]
MRPPPRPRPAAPRPDRPRAADRAPATPTTTDASSEGARGRSGARGRGEERDASRETPVRPAARPVLRARDVPTAPVPRPGTELVRASAPRSPRGASTGPGSRAGADGARGPATAPVGVVSHGMAQRLAERDAMRRHRVLRRVLWWTAGLVTAAGLGWVAFFSPVLGLDPQDVTISGEGTVIDPAQVSAAVAEEQGVPLPRLDTLALRERVLALNGVRDVEIRRTWPTGLDVRLESREPVVAVPVEEGYALLDADGVRVRTEAAVPDGLPEVDVPLDDAGRRALESALVLVNALPPELHAQVAEVSATTRDAVVMRLRDGVTVEWGSSEDAALKVRVLQTLRAVPENAGVTVYDVSAPTLPVTR